MNKKVLKMNNLNFLCDVVRIADTYSQSSIDTLELVERRVSKYLQRENYRGSLLSPPKRFYDRALPVVERYYRGFYDG